jgi:hypothetical protein
MTGANPLADAHKLMGEFQKCYRETYGKPLVLNRYKNKWNFKEVIDSVGYEEAFSAVKYYFKTESSNGHSLNFFLNNFDRMLEVQHAQEKDRERTRLLMKETRERVQAASGE